MQRYSRILLWTLIIVDNLSKFLLMGTGFLTFPDERRYLMSWSFLKHLSQADFQGSITALFSANGRPGSVLLHTIPATLQFIGAKIFGLEVFESKSFIPVFLYNFLIYSLILFLLYKLFLCFFKNDYLALLGIILYSVLVNSFVYLRHIFPYNESLLLYLYVIYDMLQTYDRQTHLPKRKMIIWALLAFLAYVIYPAYYLLYIAVFLLFNLLWFMRSWNMKQVYIYNFTYIFTSFLALAFVELLSRLGGKSYIHNFLQLSDTVTQGSFDESFSFLFKYFWEVEKWAGLLLILGILLFFFYLPALIKQKNDRKILFFWIAFFIPFLLHTGMGFFFHKMTMYGRILHQFIPVIILMNLYVFSRLNKNKQIYIILIVSILVSVSYFSQLIEYNCFAYPRDIYWKYMKTYPRDKIVELSEYKNAWSNLPEKIEGKYINPSINDSIIVVNAMFFYPYDTSQKIPVTIPDGYEKRLDKLHFIHYKAYQYEGLNKDERQILDGLNLHIKFYKTQK